MNKNDETKMIHSKFLEIYDKIDKENPSKQNLEAIKDHLGKNPALPLQALSQNNIRTMLRMTYERNGMRIEDLLRGVEAMRNELGYASASTIEKLLIDEIILEFFRSHQMQLSLTGLTNAKGINLRTIQKFDALASSAQRRLHKAIQTFAKLRKARVNLQINIATEGGKQVNLQK